MTSLNDYNININISGIPFIYNTYDHKYNNNVSTAVAGSFLINDITNFNFSSPILLTFSKNQHSVDLIVKVRRIDGDIPQGYILPDMQLIFDIYGQEEQLENSKIKYLN